MSKHKWLKEHMIISPDTYLDSGTKVCIKGKQATIVSVKEAQDQHKMPICLHTVEYTDGTIKNVNYSFIDVTCSWCPKSATQFSMGQPFCKEHQAKFADMHTKMNSN